MLALKDNNSFSKKTKEHLLGIIQMLYYLFLATSTSLLPYDSTIIQLSYFA